MDVMHARAAGMDISKRDVKVAVRHPGKRKNTFVTDVTTWRATTSQIIELIDYLKAQKVTTVVMEATSDYWKPFYYLMEDELPVMLVNAKHARNIPGRKTDVNDATWLANLAAHELLRGSFIPPEPIRELRELTRTRTLLVRDRTRVLQRIEKFLESSGIKLAAVASTLTSFSSRAMLTALAEGERDPSVLANLAKGRLRSKIPQLTEAFEGRFTPHHGFMLKIYLEQQDSLTQLIDELTAQIDQSMQPFLDARRAIETIPGISKTTAETIIAEIGVDMGQFPDAAHLASWAGVCPGLNESAGRRKSTHTREGNHHLKNALGLAALANTRMKGTYLAARYRRIAARRNSACALVAIEHTIITAIWHMLKTGEVFAELGPDYYWQRNQQRSRTRAVHQLQRLGYEVTLSPAIA